MKRLTLILLSLVALVNISCERRELVELSNTHYVRVYIKEDIKNVTCGFHPNAENRPEYKQPDILRLLLADPQTGKLKAERFLRTKKTDERGTYYEGYIVVYPGRYNLMVYNFDTEVCIVRDYTNFNNSQVYTNEIATHIRSRVSKNAMKVVQKAMQREMYRVAQKLALKGIKLPTRAGEEITEERIVYDPDHFFLANCGDIYVPYTDELDTLKTPNNDFFVAESVVKSYYIQVPVKNIDYATSSLGLVSGLAGSVKLGTAQINDEDPVTVYLELRPGENVAAGISKGGNEDVAVMYTTFNTFGKLPESENGLTITFDFLTTHGGSHTQTLDITDEFNSAQAQEQQWILVDEVIELPEPTSNPNNSGGGFKPSVTDWEDVNAEIII
ncbi:MAG: DUF5119 domain-containing protein [Bacteroidales bacterium]|nr:DUF5119 domain-containing protein [Bacteroidales bacterium]